MGEAVFYLAAKYASDEKAERAIKTVEKIAKGVAFLNEVFHEVRHQEGISPKEKSLFLNFIAGGLKRNSKREMCVAEKLRTKIDAEPYLKKKKEVGEFPDLTDLLPNDSLDVDVSLNGVVYTLSDMTPQFMLSQHGCKILLSDYVWHHTRWNPLAEKIKELTEPERVIWVSDEYTTVGDLLLKLMDFEEVKV